MWGRALTGANAGAGVGAAASGSKASSGAAAGTGAAGATAGGLGEEFYERLQRLIELDVGVSRLILTLQVRDGDKQNVREGEEGG